MALTIAQVDQAIEDILLTGQSYSRPGLTLTRANLPDLEKLRKRIIGDDARSSSGSGAALISDFSGSPGSESSEWGE